MNTQISNLLSKLSGTSKAGPRAAILQDLRIEIAAHSQEAGQQGQEAKRREIGQYAADVVEISAAHQANQARQAEITRQLSNLRGVNLGSANLAGFDLAGVDLSGANITHANLVGADFAGAALTDVIISIAKTRPDRGYQPVKREALVNG